MADDKKPKRYTGTIKYLDKQRIGYITPDVDVFVKPSSLSSDSIKQGDRVEFSIKFNDSNPNFEAIDVTPIKVRCFNCRKYGHSTKDCLKKVRISKVKCYRCNSIGHFARDCALKKLTGVGSTSNSSNSNSNSSNSNSNYSNSNSNLIANLNSNSKLKLNSVVTVKKEEDVRKVELVEDCFILEFDPSRKDDDNGDDCGKSEKKESDDCGKSEKKESDDCEELRSIVCVKNVEDVKKVEKFEDCFILEFDPDEPAKFDHLAICDDDDSEDVSILAAKGKVACRDYPHPRNLCATHPFNTTPHEIHCKMCYCYVCEKPAPCNRWTEGIIDSCMKHCDATGDIPISNTLRDLRKKPNEE